MDIHRYTRSFLFYHMGDNEMSTGKATTGQVIRVERGVYSGYSVVGFFAVLEDFDPHAELEQFLNAHPEQRDTCSFEDDEFLAVLIEKGLLKEVEDAELAALKTQLAAFANCVAEQDEELAALRKRLGELEYQRDWFKQNYIEQLLARADDAKRRVGTPGE